MKAKVSVIVPVYNVEKYVVKCISSLVNQTLKDIEIIVVNDGTKDDSIKLIKQNFNDDRIKIFNKENGGLASARNYGIKKASADYLFFVDSDDFIDENCLLDMYNTIIKDKCNLVICDYYKYYENGEKEFISTIPFYDKYDSKCSVVSMPGAVCKLFNKKIFDKYNIEFLLDHYFEDNAIMPFACAVAGKFSYIQKPYYYYLQRQGSILNQNVYNKKWEDIYDSLDNLYDSFKRYNLIEEYYNELEYIYIEYLLHAPNLKFIKYKEAYENINRTSKVLKEKFPNWRKNKYFKKENIKYKIICNLFYYGKINLIKILLRGNK